MTDYYPMTLDQLIKELSDAVIEHRTLRRGCGFGSRTESRIRTQLRRELSVALQTLAHMGYRRLPERASPHFVNQRFPHTPMLRDPGIEDHSTNKVTS